MKSIVKSVLAVALCISAISCTTHERLYSFRETYVHECNGTSISVYENSEGYVIKDTLGYGPMNSKTIYYDPQGRIIAYVGHASECYPNLLKVLYDEVGRVEYLIDNGFVDYYDKYHRLSRKKKFSDFDGMVCFDAFVAFDFFNGKKYTKDDVCYRFVYDEDGILKEILDPFDKSRSIRAESGTELTWSVNECPNFWESDLTGGYFIIYIQSEHRHPDGKVSVTTYNGYNIFSVDTFCDGVQEKKDLYALDWEGYYAGESDLHSFLKTTAEFRENEIIVTANSSDVREVYTYEVGRLVKYEKISKWNTVLVRRLYKWTLGELVEYTEYCYVFSDGALRFSSSGSSVKEESIMHMDSHLAMLNKESW